MSTVSPHLITFLELWQKEVKGSQFYHRLIAVNSSNVHQHYNKMTLNETTLLEGLLDT